MNQAEFDIAVEKLLDKDFTEWVKNECIWDEGEFYYHTKTTLSADVPFELYELFMRVTKPVFPKKEDYERVWGFDDNGYSFNLDVYADWVDARKEANKKRFLALVSPRPSTWEADYKRRKRKRFWNRIVLRYLITKDYIKNLLNIKDND
jgi:hypothetical protein